MTLTDAIRGLCDYEEKGPEVSKMFNVVTDYRYISKPAPVSHSDGKSEEICLWYYFGWEKKV